MSWWEAIIGAAVNAYGAKRAQDREWSFEDERRLAELNNPDTYTPLGSTVTDWGSGERRVSYSPEIQQLMDMLVGDIAGGAKSYQPSAGLGDLQQSQINYQRNRMGLGPAVPGEGMFGGGGGPGGGGGGPGGPPPMQPGAGSVAPTPDELADILAGISGGAGRGNSAGVRGGPGSGGGVNVGMGGLGGLPGGGGGGFGPGGFDQWMADLPDWAHKIIRSDIAQGAVGALSPIPGTGTGLGLVIDNYYNNHPMGVMSPDSPNYVPGINSSFHPQNPDFVGPPDPGPRYQFPSWTGQYNQPYEPNYSTTGRDRNRVVPGGGDGTNGGLDAYNRTLWQNPKDGRPAGNGGFIPPYEPPKPRWEIAR